jgi:type VI protein secretion system component VasK
MQLEHIAQRILSRIFRRALLALFVAIFAVSAIYYFTAAGSIALETEYGLLHARLIVGGIYTLLAVTCAIWWAVQGKTAKSSAPTLSSQRQTQIAMLIEAAMLGYALARKGTRAS